EPEQRERRERAVDVGAPTAAGCTAIASARVSCTAAGTSVATTGRAAASAVRSGAATRRAIAAAGRAERDLPERFALISGGHEVDGVPEVREVPRVRRLRARRQVCEPVGA